MSVEHNKSITIVSGHQPVYLPWLGLIHKAELADIFVFMDDVQYLNQDWNNRNKIKTSQADGLWLTVPVDLKNSASQQLKDILIHKEQVPEHKSWYAKHWNSIKASYGKTAYFKNYAPYFENLYMERKWEKLSALNLDVFKQMLVWFGVETQVFIASELNFTQKKSDLVLEHGQHFKADIVLTGTHGKEYINTDDFKQAGIQVVFQEYKHPTYEQRFGTFVSHLSFIDLLFNHGPQARAICLQANQTREDLCKLLK